MFAVLDFWFEMKVASLYTAYLRSYLKNLYIGSFPIKNTHSEYPVVKCDISAAEGHALSEGIFVMFLYTVRFLLQNTNK